MISMIILIVITIVIITVSLMTNGGLQGPSAGVHQGSFIGHVRVLTVMSTT